MNVPPPIDSLDTLFAPYNRSDAPGLVVGVAQQGKPVYRRGFGMASLEHGLVNTPATRMRIGSTTKHFTCLGILLLEAEGRLDIGKPVHTWLPELQGHHSGEPSLLQLMHHRGGLCDTTIAALLANGGYFGHLPPGSTVPLLLRTSEASFAPGTRMAYSNDGYTLLSLVIERVSGQSWNEFFTQRVFEPLGLSATVLLRSDLDLAPGMASLHVEVDGRWRRGIYFSDDLLGSGGMISTIDDMLAWAAHLRAPEKKIGDAALWQRMLQPQVFADGTISGYGLGLMTGRHRGVEIVHHAGATMGAQCQMLIAPEHALDIVVMTNRMDASAPVLALKVLEAVLGEAALGPEVEPPPAAEHPGLPGRWLSRRSRTLMAIEAKALKPERPEALTLSLYHAAAVVLHRSGAGLARPDGPYSPVEIRQPPQDGETPQELEVHICGQAERFERLPAIPPDAADLAPALCGRYRFADFGKEVEIVLRDGRLFLDLRPLSGAAEWALEPIAEDVLGCGAFHTVPAFPLPIPASLTVERREGVVAGFWLATDRVRNLRFDRCAA